MVIAPSISSDEWLSHQLSSLSRYAQAPALATKWSLIQWFYRELPCLNCFTAINIAMNFYAAVTWPSYFLLAAQERLATAWLWSLITGWHRQPPFDGASSITCLLSLHQLSCMKFCTVVKLPCCLWTKNVRCGMLVYAAHHDFNRG